MTCWIKRLLKAALVLFAAGTVLYLGVYLVTGQSSVESGDISADFLWLKGISHSNKEEGVPALQPADNSAESFASHDRQATVSTSSGAAERINESFDSISSLTIDAAVTSVTIKTSSNQEVRMQIDLKKDMEAVYSMENGHLNIQIISLGDNNHKENKIELYIPADTLISDSTIRLDLGDLKISSGKWQNLSCEMSLGDLEMENISINDGNFQLDLGDFEWKGIASGTITTECNMGDIEVELNQKETELSYFLETALGEIEINNKRVSSGSYTQNGGSTMLELKTGMGDIELEFRQR